MQLVDDRWQQEGHAKRTDISSRSLGLQTCDQQGVLGADEDKCHLSSLRDFQCGDTYGDFKVF